MLTSLVRPLPGRSARMIIGPGTAQGGNGRTAALSDCRRPPVDALMQAVSCAREAGKRLEAAGLDRLIVANRVKSPDTAADPVLLNLNVAA